MRDYPQIRRGIPAIKRHWISTLIICSSLICTSALLLPAGESSYLVKNNVLGNEIERVPIDFAKNGEHYTLRAKTKFEAKADEISLHIATHFAHPFIADSHIYSPNRECLWQGPKNQHIADNSLVTWKRVRCNTPYDGPLILDLQSSDNVTLSIWTERPSGLGPGVIKKPTILLEEGELIPTGVIRYKIDTEIHSKIKLISYLWGGISATHLYLLCSLGFCLAFLAIVVSKIYLPTSFFLMLMGVGIVQAVIVPPLQAPDEPDHLLAYGRLIEADSHKSDLLELARTVHFQRIHGRKLEKFTSKDVHQPIQDNWPLYIDLKEDMNERSVVTALAWKTFGVFFSTEKITVQILLLRLLNLFFVATVFFLAIKHVKAASLPTYLFLLATMPSLAFFILHVSNYFSAIAVYLVVGSIILLLIENRKWSSACSVTFAFASGTAIFTNTSGIGLGVVIFAVLALSNGRELVTKLNKLQYVLVFYATFSFWILLKILFSSTQANPNFSFAQAISTSELLFAAVPLVLLVNLDMLGREVWLRKKAELGVVVLAISLTALSVFQSIWEFDLLTAHNIENGQIPSAFLYIIQCVATFFSDLLPSRLNFYISETFWFGFGWLEKMPPDWAINIIKMPFSICFAITVIYLFNKRKQSSSITPIMLLLSILTYLAGMAYATNAIGVNLHGRYLIGCYIFLAALFSHASHNYYCDFKIRLQRSRAGRLATYSIPIGILISIHSYVIFFLAERYY